jgi:predicted RNA-binding Zn ribbon-like protein
MMVTEPAAGMTSREDERVPREEALMAAITVPGAGRGHDIGEAPGRLAAVQAFVNTLDVEAGTDQLGSPAALDSWLRSADLTEHGTWQSGPAELALAVDLREALRGILRSHVTHNPAAAARPSAAAPADPAARLAEISSPMQARISADADGSVRVVAGGSGSRGALAGLLLIAAEACTLGTWTRLKVCSADDCQWAFYDRSPTRSGCWCSMQICGSRAKSRAYRRRGTRASRSARTEAPGA